MNTHRVGALGTAVIVKIHSFFGHIKMILQFFSIFLLYKNTFEKWLQFFHD